MRRASLLVKTFKADKYIQLLTSKVPARKTQAPALNGKLRSSKSKDLHSLPLSETETHTHLAEVVIVGHEPGADDAANAENERRYEAEGAVILEYSVIFEQVEQEERRRDHVVERPKD
jgi:hypothetical protein